MLTLPDSIGNLEQLEILWAFNGKLRRLPDTIGDLQNLTYLGVHNNDLYNLPASIINLSSLEDINFSGNNFSFEDLTGDQQIFLNRCCEISE